MSTKRWVTYFIIAAAAVILALVLGIGNSRNKSEVEPPSIQAVGFNEVRKAKDGDRVTLIDYLDIKYLCMDLNENQRDVCTTAVVRSSPEGTEILEIKLHVCSDQRKTNCIVMDINPRNVDFRNVYVLDNAGQIIDFDGWILLKPPNTWTSRAVKLKLTGRVTVVNGEGELIEPIEKIEAG